MNKLTIIGRLTGDPELRTTQDGKSVCNFSVAVNRRKKGETDFFRVNAWNAMGENCAKYLTKGKQVAVTGPVSVHTFTKKDGQPGANMEVMADDVEFLSSREPEKDKETGYEKVDEELPF